MARTNVLVGQGWVDTGDSGTVVGLTGKPRGAVSASAPAGTEEGVPIPLGVLCGIEGAAGETLWVLAGGEHDAAVDTI